VSLSCVDDSGRTLALAAPPRRIVSLVPSLTEVVCALGAAPRLVGVTRYCTDPPEVVATLPKVGGTKNPDLAAIAALRPDLVLMNAEENRREDFDALVGQGLIVFVSHPRDVRAAALSIERVGIALGCAGEGAAQRAAIEAALHATNADGALRPRVFCPIWRKPWMSFNRETFAHDLLASAGGHNVCADRAERYPEVDLAEIAELAPDVVLLPDEPYHFSPRDLPHLAALADTPALRRQRVHFVDGKALSWYGPRTPSALRLFDRLLRN